MESKEKEKTFTVQGVMSPVPAAVRSGQAGSQSSLTSDRNATAVVNLAAVADTSTSTDIKVANLASIPDNVTSDRSNPFTRSSKVHRSPQRNLVENFMQQPPASLQRSNSASDIMALQKKGAKMDEMPQQVPPLAAKGKMATLEWHAKALLEYVSKRHNVHGEIKKMARKISDLCIEAALEFEAMRVAVQPKITKEDQAVQTGTQPVLSFAEMLSRACPTPKRPREEDKRSPTKQVVSKRPRNRNSGQVSQTPAGVLFNAEEEKVKEKMETDAMPPDKEVWSTASKKKRSRSKRNKPSLSRPRRLKPDAIVIGKVGELSYADILRKVKGDPNLKEIGDNVARVRRTYKGEMLIELNKEAGNNKDCNFHLMVKKALGDQACVRSLSPQLLIECKDIDEITSKEEIQDALVKQFNLPNLDVSAVKSLRKAYGGTQIATISLPVELAQKVLLVGKLKVGWTVCKLRELIRPLNCFKCLDFGHTAKDCKNNDRSDWCRRCGGKGHQAKQCDKDPSCMLCKGVEGLASTHISGSSICPAYRRALYHARK